MSARLSLVAVATGALLVTGCNGPAPVTTAAAMRVEVEVYKGPLAKEREVQFGELLGTLDEAVNSLSQLRRFLAALTALERRKLAPTEYSARLQLVADLGRARDDVAEMLAKAQAFNLWYQEHLAGITSTARTTAVEPSRRVLENAANSLTISNVNAAYCGSIPSLTATPSGGGTRVVRDWAAFCLIDADTHLVTMEKTLAEKKYERLRIDYQGLDRLLRNAEWKKRADEAGEVVATAELRVVIQERTMVAFSKAVDEFVTAAIEQRGTQAYRDLKNNLKDEQLRGYLIGLLAEIGGLARQLHAKALFWSGSHIAFSFTGFEGTRLPASLAALLGTYADRIGPRADSLIKQLSGQDPNGMALSVALRETSLPAFLQQYVWNGAGGSLSGIPASAEHTRDRVRAIERLYTDEHWTSINTVYASGQGTVRMALIKDDIGNWNLKSFDQDPSKLLEAYRNAGLAGLSVATGLITKAVSAGSGAALQQALSMANQLTSGTAPGGTPTLGSSNLAELRGEVVERLTKLTEGADARRTALQNQLKPLKEQMDQAVKDELRDKGLLDTAATNKSSDETAYHSALATWAKTKADLDAKTLAYNKVKAEDDALPATLLTQSREILTAHEKVVDALEGAIVRNRSTTPELKDIMKLPATPALPAVPASSSQPAMPAVPVLPVNRN